MLALISTFFEITLLRKGPEDIPPSGFMLGGAVALWMVGLLASIVLIPTFGNREAVIALISSLMALFCYYILLVLVGKTHRFLQTSTAMIGCGSLISLAIVIELVVAGSLFRPEVAGLGALLLLFWSVPVKGHILARASDLHWYLGIVVAGAVFIMQYMFSVTMTPAPAT